MYVHVSIVLFYSCFMCKRYHVSAYIEFNMEIVVEEIQINKINLYKSLHIVIGADIEVTAVYVPCFILE